MLSLEGSSLNSYKNKGNNFVKVGLPNAGERQYSDHWLWYIKLPDPVKVLLIKLKSLSTKYLCKSHTCDRQNELTEHPANQHYEVVPLCFASVWLVD